MPSDDKVFDAIGAVALHVLVERMGAQPIKAGAALFKEGEPGDALYLLLEGELRISCSQGDVQVVVGSIAPGEVVGEMAVIEPAPRSATATAVTDSKVARLSVDEFSAMVEAGEPEAHHLLHQIRVDLCRRLRGLDERLEVVLCTDGHIGDDHAEVHLLRSLIKTIWPWG